MVAFIFFFMFFLFVFANFLKQLHSKKINKTFFFLLIFLKKDTSMKMLIRRRPWWLGEKKSHRGIWWAMGNNFSQEGKSNGDNKRNKVVTETKSINFLSENIRECLMAHVSLAESPKWTINSVIFQDMKSQKKDCSSISHWRVSGGGEPTWPSNWGGM